MSHKQPFFTFRISIPRQYFNELHNAAKDSFKRFSHFDCKVKRVPLSYASNQDILHFEITTPSPTPLLDGVQKIMVYIHFIVIILRAFENKTITSFSIKPFDFDEYHITIDDHPIVTMKQFREMVGMHSSLPRDIN